MADGINWNLAALTGQHLAGIPQQYQQGVQNAQQRRIMDARSTLSQLADPNAQAQALLAASDIHGATMLSNLALAQGDRQLRRETFDQTKNFQNAKLKIDQDELALKQNVFKTKQDQTLAAANAPATPDVDGEGKLRKEYSGHNKTFLDVRRAYDRILASNDDAVGDLSMIFGYMRMLDPSSTVREGEFANAQNTVGVPDQIRNLYNRAITGERLNPTQRTQFKNQATSLYGRMKKEHDAVTGRYRNLATAYGFSPDRVLLDYGPEPAPQAAPPAGPLGPNDRQNPNPAANTAPPAANAPKVQISTQAEFQKLPPGSLFIMNGKSYQKP